MHAEGGMLSQILFCSDSHLLLGNLPHLVKTSCLKTSQRQIKDDSLYTGGTEIAKSNNFAIICPYVTARDNIIKQDTSHL